MQHSSDAAAWLAAWRTEPMPSYVYTYPPKPAYAPVTGSGIDAWNGYSGALNVYVHVPFCAIKCGFCNLFTTRLGGAVSLDRYLAALHRELAIVADRMGPVELASVHFGGGTPALLGAPRIAALLDDLRARFTVRADAEIAIEGTPRSLDPEVLAGLHSAGINRVSIGIQSFDAAELREMGRAEEAAAGRATVAQAIATGFRNVNVDLIYGLPQQTRAAFRRNLEEVVAIGPRTLTLYPLVLRERTPFGARLHTEDTPDLYPWYDDAVAFLAAHGYEQRTLVLYAREGGGNGFEEQEFLGVPTLGLGAGARSYAPTVHYTADDYFRPAPPARLVEAWLESVEAGRLHASCAADIGPDEAIRRSAILLLLYRGIDAERFRSAFAVDPRAYFADQLAALDEEGWLVADGGRIRLNAAGMRHSSVVARLLYRPGIEHEASGYR